MAAPQSKKNPWDIMDLIKNAGGKSGPVDFSQMLNISGDQTNPAVMSQMSQQASTPPPQDGGMSTPTAAPQEEIGGMSMAPPQPQVTQVPPQKVKLTAQPTSQKVGELPQEITPTQQTIMTRDQMIANLRPPDDSAMMREMKLGEATQAASQNLQQGEVQKLKDQLAKFQGEPQRKDYRPIAAAFDSWFGSKLSGAADATAPMSPEKRAELMAEMQKAIVASQGQLTASQQEALKNKLAQMGYMSERQMKADIAKITAMGQTGAADARAARVGTQQDRLAAQAGEKFNNDELMKQTQKQIFQMDIDTHTIETADVVTPQMFDEVQKGLANAVAGGRQAAVSDTQAMKMENLSTEFARFAQKVTSGVVDINSPEVKDYLVNTIARLKEGYQQNAMSRAKQLAVGAEDAYSHTPRALDVVNKKVKSYGVTNTSPDEDSQALDWAKKNPTDPRAAKILQQAGAQ